MGNQASALPKEQLERLHHESGLTKSSIKMLYERFETLAKLKDDNLNQLFLTPEDFEEIPELLRNPLGSRLIQAFFCGC
ncbi:unnamed protein product [Bursaphelenchus okinawaensis]|uniref:Uncharacterized protein n=1 Tax=Bursaphelenchus okinawaensis TaxID=465554 RepID=A0A811KPV2_9BILA|nr:unnamed protein product [Bursaphelenchus okinawaensis]CAG9107607.1 unnamed protein product [Bursaphelenchus okinawaensis]